jgi:hypothetical protein
MRVLGEVLRELHELAASQRARQAMLSMTANATPVAAVRIRPELIISAGIARR